MAVKRPKSITMGRVKARVQRGPRADGRWYWKADRQAGPTRETVWCGWGAVDEAEKAIRKALDEDPVVDAAQGEYSGTSLPAFEAGFGDRVAEQ